MRNLVRVVAASVVAVVAACGGGNKPAPETPPPSTSSMLDCGKVADHVAATVVAAKPRPGATQGAIKEMVSTRCQADKWSDETKQCLNAMATIADGRACDEKMTDEQRTAIKTAAKSLSKDASGPVATDDPSSDWVRHVVEEPAKPTR